VSGHLRAPAEFVNLNQLGDMFLTKKYFAILLSVMVTALSFSFTTNAQTTAADVQQTRAKVQTLAVNRDKKVEVKLKDTTKVKGYITAVDQDSFAVSNTATGSGETIAYTDVVDIKKSGGGFSTKSWLIIGGVAAGVVTTWIIVKPAVCDGGAQTRGIC